MSDASSSAAPSPQLRRMSARHRRWLDRLGLRTVPWMIFGSAPAPTVPPEIRASHARVDINNAGRTAAEMGLGRAALTLRAKHKSWEEHPHLDTRGLIWIHTAPMLFMRLKLIGKPYDHVGTVTSLTKRERDELVPLICGASVKEIGDLGKVSNGVAAACLAIHQGVPEIVLAGISLSKSGHSYDQLGRTRRQVEEDAFCLSRLKNHPALSTTEPDLAEATGLRLWTPPTKGR